MTDPIADLLDRVASIEAVVHTQAPVPADALYKVGEVAARLRCQKTNVYDLIKTGALAVTRVGAGNAGLRVRGCDLLAFLDSRKEGGPQPAGTFKYMAKYLK